MNRLTLKLGLGLGLLMTLLPLVFIEISAATVSCNEHKKLFACDNGDCVYMAWRCDGVNDCGDFSDENYCLPEPLPDHEFVVIADAKLKNIFQLWPETGDIFPLLPVRSPNPVAVTIDLATKDIYYTDVVDATIGRIRVDVTGGRAMTIIYTDNVGGAVFDGLAIDSQRSKLYYSNNGLVGSLGEMSTDGSAHRVLLRGSGLKPRAVVIDPVKRLLYWTDWGDKPSISVMNVVTLQKQVIISTNLRLPNALVIEGNVMMWADAGTKKLEQSNLDGTNRRQLLKEEGSHYFALALSPSHLYVNDWNLNNIETVDRSTMQMSQQQPVTFLAIRGIAVYYPSSASNKTVNWYQSRHATSEEL